MNRNLTIERLYPLGDFRNIKFHTEFNNIPQVLAMDDNFIAKLSTLLMVECDVMYRVYLQLMKKYDTMALEESLEALDKIRVDTLGEISAYIEEHKKEE